MAVPVAAIRRENGHEISRKARQARKEEERRKFEEPEAFTFKVTGPNVVSSFLGALCALCANPNPEFRLNVTAHKFTAK